MDGVDLKDLRKRMEGAIGSLKSEFGGLRTGRASASLVEQLMLTPTVRKHP